MSPEFLKTQNCFYPTQFDFRLNVSTNNALMTIAENIQTQQTKENIALEFLLISKKPLIQSITIYYYENLTTMA